MLRRILIALGIGIALILLLPKLIERQEITFEAFATIQAQAKNFQQSESAQYQNALRRASSDPVGALDLLNAIAFSESEYSQDARTLSIAIRSAQREENDAYTYALVGQALAQINSWELSALALERAVKANPEYAEAWAYLGEARQQEGKDGFEALEIARQLKPLSFSVNLFQALYWQRQANYDEALRFLKIAQLSDPENIQIVLEQARTYVLAGNVLEARSYFERAVELEPENPNMWKTLAHYSLDNDVFLEEIGLPASRRALVLNAQDPEALLLMAKASFRSLGSSAEALRLLDSALTINPKYFAAHLEKATILIAIGDLQAAKPHLEEALAYSGSVDEHNMAQSLYENYYP